MSVSDLIVFNSWGSELPSFSVVGADIPAEPDEFEEQAFWLAFDWWRDEKRYKRNPKADKKKD